MSTSAVDNSLLPFSMEVEIEDEIGVDEILERCIPIPTETNPWNRQLLEVDLNHEFTVDRDSSALEESSQEDTTGWDVTNNSSSSSPAETAGNMTLPDQFSNQVDGTEETVPDSGNQPEIVQNSGQSSSQQQENFTVTSETGGLVWQVLGEMPVNPRFGQGEPIILGQLVQMDSRLYCVYHVAENGLLVEHQEPGKGPPAKIPRLEATQVDDEASTFFGKLAENSGTLICNKIAEVVYPNSREPIETGKNSGETEQIIQEFTFLADEITQKNESTAISSVDSVQDANEYRNHSKKDVEVACNESKLVDDDGNQNTNSNESNCVIAQQRFTTDNLQPLQSATWLSTPAELNFSNQSDNLNEQVITTEHALIQSVQAQNSKDPGNAEICARTSHVENSNSEDYQQTPDMPNINSLSGEGTEDVSASSSLTKPAQPSTSSSTCNGNRRSKKHVDYYYVKLNQVLEDAHEALSLEMYGESKIIKVFGRRAFLAVFSNHNIINGSICGRPEKGQEMKKFSAFQIGVVSRFLGFLHSNEELSWENFRRFQNSLSLRKLNGLTDEGFKYLRESILVKYASEVRSKLRKERM